MNEKQVMPKQVSALNTFWIVGYIEKYYPKVDVNELVARVNQVRPYYLRNLKTARIEQVSRAHLIDTDNWFSNRFMIELYDAVQSAIPDRDLAYKLGSTSYQTGHILKTAIGVPLLGPRRLLNKIAKESAKYIRTKDTVVIVNKPGYAVIRLIHYKDIIINDFAMNWHGGVFVSYARLAGAKNIKLKIHCVDKGPKEIGEPGQGIWDFEITYDREPFWQIIIKSFLFNIPVVKKEIDKANEIQADYTEQLLNRDRIIYEKTKKNEADKEKLLQMEKINSELKLKKLSDELTDTEVRERQSIAEDLHDSVSQTLGLCLINLSDIIDSGRFNASALIQTKAHLEQAVNSIRSLTFQLNPPILKDFGLESAVDWLVKDISGRYELKLEFSNDLPCKLNLGETFEVNLFRSIRELLVNIIKHAHASQAQVKIFLENESACIEIQDDGIGFDTEKTWQKKLNSYGLHSVKKRLALLGCDIEIDSAPGKGTRVWIKIPVSRTENKGESTDSKTDHACGEPQAAERRTEKVY